MAKRRRTTKLSSRTTTPPVQPGNSLLELLPNELLLAVIGNLAPAHASLKYTKDHQAHRAVLRNLCLVSKRMDVFARPALYCDLRMYSFDRSIRLCASLLAYPQLTSHVKSILFFPPYGHFGQKEKDSCLVDFRSLSSLSDPDFVYWTAGRNAAKVEMPRVTRDEMVYNLLFKVLSQTPRLEALYIKLPETRPPRSDQVFHRKADAKCLQQLDLQHRLFEGFCQGPSIPHLPNLKIVGVLGGRKHSRHAPKPQGFSRLVPLFQSFVRSPNLVEMCWASMDSFQGPPPLSYLPPLFWDSPLLSGQSDWPAAPHHFNAMSASVKRINLRGISIAVDNIRSLTRAFPAFESLTIEDNCDTFELKVRFGPDVQSVFESLGQLENLHTLVLDHDPHGFGRYTTTATGWYKSVDLSALSKIQTLLVSMDFFAYFTRGENPLIQRATTILPDSLRRVTLLLNTQCKRRLADQFQRKFGVKGVIREFLRELAATLLVESPHLDKVDVCYHMEHYRQDKVFTLADRSTTRAT